VSGQGEAASQAPCPPGGAKKGQSTMRQRPRSGVRARDRGAAAVEFALCLPILLLLVFGIIDFGRALNAQITLTQAANEGVRLAALGDPGAEVQARAEAAAPELSGVVVTIVASCPPGAGPAADAQVDVSYVFSFATPVGAIVGLVDGSGFGSPITLTAQGVEPCET
jgi:TadE-like protein